MQSQNFMIIGTYKLYIMQKMRWC